MRAKLADESLSYATMASAVASKQISDEMSKSMEAMVKALEEIAAGKTTKVKKSLAGIFSERGLGLTETGIADIASYGSVEAYMSAVGIDATMAEEMGMTLEELTKKLVTNFENAQ